MCVAGFVVTLLPSPNVQVKVTLPTPPVDVAVKETLCPTSGVAGLSAKLTVRARAVVIVWLELATAPSASVTVTITLKLPAVEEVCDTGFAFEVPPSPKAQLKVNGPAPPVVLAGESIGGV